ALDEADEIVLGQKWSWGYGPQAPLFTWLLRMALGTFGFSIFTLALIRELLCFTSCVLVYVNARKLTGRHDCGVAAMAALFFFPSFSWESQRDLTHSILAWTMVLAMLLTFLRLGPDNEGQTTAEPASWGRYLAFGLCGALSTLSKYNAVLVYLGLIISACVSP